MMKILSILLFLGITDQAMAAGPVKTIAYESTSYPVRSVEDLLVSSTRELAMTDEGLKACPRGIDRILKIRTEVIMIGTRVPGYPEYSVLALVQCK